ncbi:hypothetical protein ACHAWF_010230 [Thalassiosira exigua]
MAKGFGKIKGLIGKGKGKGSGAASVPSTPTRKGGAGTATPTSTPPREPQHEEEPRQEEEQRVINVAQEKAPSPRQSPQPAPPAAAPPAEEPAGNTADEVLDGILQDLNITQLAVDAERTDTISEFSGGSAKSVETSDDEEETDEEDDEQETDEEDDEEEDHDIPAALPKKKKTVGDRVAVVLASADEIKRRMTPSPVQMLSKGSESPTTEPGGDQNRAPPARAGSRASSPSSPTSPRSQTESRTSGATGKSGAKSDVRSRAASKSLLRMQEREARELERETIARQQLAKEQRSAAPSKASKMSMSFMKKAKSAKQQKKAQEQMAQIAEQAAAVRRQQQERQKREQQQQQQQKGRGGQGKRRSTSPEFSPEMITDDEETDTLDNSLTDEGTFPEEEETLDTNTLGDGTLDTDGDFTYEDEKDRRKRDRGGGDSGSQDSDGAEASTFEEEEDAAAERHDGGAGGKKTVMNKDIIIHQAGGPSSLVVRAMYYTPLPATPEDIIIKVEASTVSFRDCLLRRGIGLDKVTFPFVPGCEVVGTISNVGKAARLDGYRVGDRVVGMTRRGGGNGYYAKLQTKNVAPISSTTIDAADAVCLVNVYMTAYQALRVGKKDGTPLTDANVLVTDGYSPVGQAAVALAKLEGANVYVTTTEGRQDEYMRTLGVKCLPLAPSKWLHKLKGKMDIVIDNTCFDSYDSSWKALNVHGVLVCTGTTSLYSLQDHGNANAGGCGCEAAFGDFRDYQAKWVGFKAKYMMSQTSFHDLWESFRDNPKKYQQELKYLCFLVESGTLKPKIAERVSIEEVPDAQRYLETGKANGTIVCLP